MNNSTEIQQSVIAILKNDNRLRAIQLVKQDGNFRILWSKSSRENVLDWQAFGAECGIITKITNQEQTPSKKNVAIGYDSSGTAFYQVNLPMVEEKDIPAIVSLQAESRFPLPASQMELAWRTSKLPNNQTSITIAAARKQTIHNFIDKVRVLHPSRVILDYEAIVRVWKELFFGNGQNTIIVNAGTHSTQICLAEKGMLCSAVSLDVGTVDFGENDTQENSETIERVVQDIRSVVDLFGLEKQFEIPVIVLSDGSKLYEILSDSLQSIGLNARSEKPSIEKLDSDKNSDLKNIFEYRAAIGLAFMALDSKHNELNLFTYLFINLKKEVKNHWFFSTKITGAVAAIMLLLFVMVSYAEIAGGSRAIDDKLTNLGSDSDINNLVEKQKLFKEVAKQRADLLVLLNQITQSGFGNPDLQNNIRPSNTKEPNPEPKKPSQSGIQLDSFHFKKRNQVTITGKAQTKEQLENFEKCLSSNKDITEVHLSPKSSNGSARSTSQKPNGKNPPPPANPGGGQDKGFAFTITFNYKDFSISQRR